MKGFSYKRSAALLIAMLLLLVPVSALAEAPTVTVSAGGSTLNVGDTVEMTVTVKGGGMSVAEGIFTYDPAVLSFTEGIGGASDGFLSIASAQKNGTDSLTARIKFTAVGAGSTDVKVNIEKVFGYDGSEQQTGTALGDTLSFTVAAPAATPTPTPIDYAKEGVAAQNVKNATESLYIWRTLENVTVPSGYSETTLTYHGETVAAATVADSDAPTLLYLSNASGSVGGYYIYNAATDTIYQYQTVSSVSKSYIILEPDGSVPLPAGFTETTLTAGEKTYTAWKSQDAQGDIFLLYARNSDGEVGYYVYNAEDESLQRYAVMPARIAQPTLPPVTPNPADVTPAPQESAAPAPENTIAVNRVLFFAICGVGGLIVILTVAFLVLRSVEDSRRRRRAAARKAARERAKAKELDR
ncbi:MAG: cohesin domain-containing protein [Clostridiaceae bacterium]|nr:cohesin domain-containing protein [Eubacteriales bacterium]